MFFAVISFFALSSVDTGRTLCLCQIRRKLHSTRIPIIFQDKRGKLHRFENFLNMKYDMHGIQEGGKLRTVGLSSLVTLSWVKLVSTKCGIDGVGWSHKMRRKLSLYFSLSYGLGWVYYMDLPKLGSNTRKSTSHTHTVYSSQIFWRYATVPRFPGSP